MTKRQKKAGGKPSPIAILLRKSGYKATAARVAILEYFKKNPRPLSAQHIVDNIGKDIDQATIYRTIKSLKEKNIIRQVDLRHNHAHYEFADLTEHHHLICTQCGKVEDVHHCDIENMRTIVLKQSKYFGAIQQHSLEFYGVCKACAKKDKALQR